MPPEPIQQPVFRFAPSPTGQLHIGHALSALIGCELAARMHGRFIVRIEDTDTGRAREAFVSGILEDLAWLGLVWEKPVWRQSDRLAVYAAQRDRLREMGLLYPCFATRAEIAEAASRTRLPMDPDGAPLYPGLSRGLPPCEVARRIAKGESYALRLDMERALAVAMDKLRGAPLSLTRFAAPAPGGTALAETETVALSPQRWGDVVIARKDTGTSYHLAGVIDDAAQGVTHVVRGQDLEAATDIHRLLQVLLGLPQPLYHHHALVRDETGRKLSKSAGDTALASLRENGASPDDVRSRLQDLLAPYTA